MRMNGNDLPIGWEDAQFQRDAQNLSKFVLTAYKTTQQARPAEIFDSGVTACCILAATSFAVGMLLKDLPPRERKRLREYLVHKLDDVLREHGAAG